jgi:integrase/recombinase XerD
MKPLKKGIREYVGLRRSFGYKLQWTPSLLFDFAAFLKRRRAAHITGALALEWAARNPLSQPKTVTRRLSAVRGFARYWSGYDPRTQIPPPRLLPEPRTRFKPYLYTDTEVMDLLTAARSLPRRLHGFTQYCVIGLLSVTGSRIAEICNLRPGDVDLENGVLVIRDTKFGKSRLVPIHPSTQRVLAEYARQRDRCFGRKVDGFFINLWGNRVQPSRVRDVFRRLCRQKGLRGPNAKNGPRLHDFRHRFAVKTLVNWYRSGTRIEECFPVLSTYLGHGQVTATYWYLTACPELMGLAVNRFERHWGKGL